MGFLAPLARLLGIETDVLLRQLRENAVAFAAIGVFAMIGVAFLLVAANTALTWYVGPLWAPLIIAAAAFVVALALFATEKMRKRSLRRRAAEAAVEAEGTALVASAALSLLPDLLSSPAVRNIGLPIALYAGFLLLSGKHGSKPAGTARPRPRSPIT